jgi:uncharacterized ion transporter superfamily protein YfcC
VSLRYREPNPATDPCQYFRSHNRVSRELLVTAYQCGTGLVNLVAPTSGVVMGALALGRIPFTAYLRFMAPLLAKLALLCVGVLVAGVALAR